MPRQCSICMHAEKAAIDAALVANEPYRMIAVRTGTSPAALQRHKEHLPVALTKAQEAQEVIEADDLLGSIRTLHKKSIALLEKAEGAGDIRTALMGIREARSCIELVAEMEGELNRRPQFNLYLSAEWIEVRAVLLIALGDFPEARAAAAQALQGMHHGNS